MVVTALSTFSQPSSLKVNIPSLNACCLIEFEELLEITSDSMASVTCSTSKIPFLPRNPVDLHESHRPGP